MDEIAALTPEQARMLLQDYYARQRPARTTTIYPPTIFEYAVLQAALPAATSAHDGWGTSTAKLLVNDANDDLILSNITVDVVNVFEHISFEDDTLVVLVKIRGKWQVTAADCEPLSASTLLSLAGS